MRVVPSSDPRFRVTVIIPVLNDFRRLRICLDALAAQTWDRDRLEVMVVDNGSDADVTEVTRSFEFVEVHREATPGSYAARNAGLEHATGNIIAFTDSDCVPEPNWIEQGVAAVQRHGPQVVVGGQVVLFAENPQRPTLAEEFELSIGFSQRMYIHEKHYSVTANLFTTPHVLAKVGPFDATLKSGGDKEWGTRAHGMGVKLHYEENAIVRHPARASMRELFHKRARIVGGHLAIARAHYPEWAAFLLILGRSCLPPVQRVIRSQSQGAAPSRRRRRLDRALKVGLVGASLQAYSALELVRLQLGKPPVR